MIVDPGTGLAIGAVLVNLGINLATLAEVRTTVQKLQVTDAQQQEKLYNHDSRISVLEDRAGLKRPLAAPP